MNFSKKRYKIDENHSHSVARIPKLPKAPYRFEVATPKSPRTAVIRFETRAFPAAGPTQNRPWPECESTRPRPQSRQRKRHKIGPILAIGRKWRWRRAGVGPAGGVDAGRVEGVWPIAGRMQTLRRVVGGCERDGRVRGCSHACDEYSGCTRSVLRDALFERMLAAFALFALFGKHFLFNSGNLFGGLFNVFRIFDEWMSKCLLMDFVVIFSIYGNFCC